MTEEDMAIYDLCRLAYLDFTRYCNQLGNTRELNLAKTNVEQGFMWLKEHKNRVEK